MRRIFETHEDKEVRIRRKYATEVIKNLDISLQELRLYAGQTVLVEVQNFDATWPREV